MIEIRFLGQFQIHLHGESVDIPLRTAQSVFAYLALNANTPQRREKLAGLIWPDSNEKNARNSLRHSLWQIREAFRLVAKGDFELFNANQRLVSFDPPFEYWMDTQEIVKQPLSHSGVDDIITSVSSYGGELLPGFYDNWVLLEREMYRSEFEQKIDRLLALLLEEQRWEEVTYWGERWIALGLVPEAAYRALMLAYHHRGELGGVAHLYERCVKLLREELDVEPSDQTKELYRSLLNGHQAVQSGARFTALENAHTEYDLARELIRNSAKDHLGNLDITSLSILHTQYGPFDIDQEATSLLIRSALYNDVDLAPWVRRAPTRKMAAQALMNALSITTSPHGRLEIIEALKELELESADRVLLELVEKEKVTATRSAAAVAAVERGMKRETVAMLAAAIRKTGDLSAFQALVVVADESGLPSDFTDFPKLPFIFLLAQRRWEARRQSILRQTFRTAIGLGVTISVSGIFAPFWYLLYSPDDYFENLKFISLAGWSFSGVLLGIIWGSLVGLALGFFVALGDGLLPGRRSLRLIAGALAGLLHGGFLIAGTLMELNTINTIPLVYIFVLIIYGCVTGFGLTFLIPEGGVLRPASRQILYIGLITPILLLATYLQTNLVYVGKPSTLDIVRPLGIQIFFVLGVAISFARFRRQTNARSVVSV